MRVAGLLFVVASACLAQNACKAPDFSQFSAQQILACADGHCCATTFDLGNALHGKISPTEAMKMMGDASAEQKEVIVLAFAGDKGHKADKLMRADAKNVQAGSTGEDNHYFSLQYLADRCDTGALAALNRDENFNDSYPVGCILWQETLIDFGKCQYLPSALHLVQSFNSACVDNIDAAERSLRKLFPHSPCFKGSTAGGTDQCLATEIRARVPK